MSRSPLLRLGLGLALLLTAWIFATHPFASPDEKAHYVRALGITDGQLLSPKGLYRPGQAASSQLDWQRRDARAVMVPADLAPPSGGIGGPQLCVNGLADTGPRPCPEVTYTGDYAPLPYLLPAAALDVASSTSSGLWLSRVASALPCLIFLLVALAALQGASALSLVGCLAALTPMVLFISSVINPNGMEIAASIAFVATGLRIVRDDAAPAWVWWAAAVSGGATILAWQVGPVFCICDVVALVALAGGRVTRLRAARNPVRTVLLALVLLVGVGLYGVWDAVTGPPHSTLRVLPLSSLHGGVNQLHEVFREAVGVFGMADIPMKSELYLVWWFILLALWVAAIWVGTPRERGVLVAVAVFAVGFPIVFDAWAYRFSGFPLQGRYVLPMIVLVPLLSGEVLSAHRAQLGAARSRWMLAAFGIVIAVVQLYAWWTEAHIEAHANHHPLFPAHAGWAPPLGWWLWIVVAVLGCGLMATVGLGRGVLPARSGSDQPEAAS